MPARSDVALFARRSTVAARTAAAIAFAPPIATSPSAKASTAARLLMAMGLDARDFERDGVVGFGGYSGYLLKNVGAQYLTDAEKRKPLPMPF